MMSSWLKQRRFRRRLESISGHESSIIWLLPLFVPVLMLISYVESSAPSSSGSHINAVVWALVSVLIVFVLAFYWIERRRAVAFLQWLHNQRDALRIGRAEYSGHAVSRSTDVIQYRICVSLVLFTIEFSSRFFIPTADRPWQGAIGATVVTCLLGWWGIPFGPLSTIAAVIENVRGGHRRSVQDLLNAMPAETSENT